MKCEKCQKTIRSGVKFCPNCGEPLKGGDTYGSESRSEKTDGNSRQKADTGDLMAKKSDTQPGESGKKHGKKLFTLVGAAVILAVLCVILGRPKPVSLSPSEYVEVTCSGLNGEGKASLKFQTEKFMEALGEKKKLKPAQQSEIMGILKNADQYFSLTKNTELKNGDKLSIQCSMPEALLNAYQVRIKNAETGFTVAGLTEVQRLKLEDYGVLSFSGFEGYGYVDYHLDYEALYEAAAKLVLAAEDSAESVNYINNSLYDDIYACVSDMQVDKTDNISNGDTVHVSYTVNPDNKIEAYGIAFEPSEKDVEVSGLEEIAYADVFEEKFENGNLTLKDKNIDLITDDMTIVSVSPDGTKLLGYRENGDRPMFIADLEKQQIIDIWPDYENSVEDTYGMVKKSLEMCIYYAGRGMINDAGAVVWSPDGRYIALTNYRRVIYQGVLMDLLLITTADGAMRDMETSSGSFSSRDGDVGASPFSVCFDPVLPVLYYVEWGARYETACTLKKLDLISEEITVLGSMPDIGDAGKAFFSDRDLYCPTAGKIVFTGEDVGNDYRAFGTAREIEGSWDIKISIYEQYSESYQYYPKYLYFSHGNTGITCWTITGKEKYHEVYSIMDVNDPMQISILQFESVEQNRVDTIGIQELISSLENGETADLSDENCILGAAISPDGKYALLEIMGSSREDIRFKVLNLNTLEWKDVGVPEDIRSYPHSALSAIFEDGIRWGAGNLILALDENSEIRILEFAED